MLQRFYAGDGKVLYSFKKQIINCKIYKLNLKYENIVELDMLSCFLISCCGFFF